MYFKIAHIILKNIIKANLFAKIIVIWYIIENIIIINKNGF